MSSNVRVRFAPSPTGYLHVGGARTALYNYLYARKTGGKFILRIEDTDLERSTEQAMRMQIQDLEWLGLNWDEGPDPKTLQDKGPHAPYRQSQRAHIYREHAERLLEAGMAYYDFRTDEELEKLREEASAEGRALQMERPKDIVPLAEARKRVAAGEKGAIRFKIKEQKDYSFVDLVRGEVKLPSDMVGDFVILRSNGMPVYNFCCVVDDALMKITHVFRAEEHLSNTVRQLMLYEAFSYPPPVFGHLSIILGADRQKLSKRHGATSCHEFAERGYLPEALINFVALLGWSSPKGDEVMTREQLIEQFDYDRLIASSAVFDDQKFAWMNATHLRLLNSQELWRRLQPFLAKAGLQFPNDVDWQNHAIESLKPAMTNLVEAVELFKPLNDALFKLEPEAQEVLAWPETKKVWQAWEAELKAHPGNYLSEAEFNAAQDKVKVATGAKGKTLFQPIRVAVIGKPNGTELKLLVPLLPKTSLLKRVETCLKALA